MISKFVLSVLVLPVLCHAGAVSFSGLFGADNQEQFFSLSASSATSLTAETWSYGGGNGVLPGGFAPELSVFNSSGQLIALDAFGGSAPGSCGPRSIDPSTHSCLDAVIAPLQITAGVYTLVLTEQGNNPVGLLSDGFSEDAANGNNPSFTGDNAGDPGGMFLDPGNSTQRTNQWDLAIAGAALIVSETPEPSSAMLLGAGLFLMGIAIAGRRVNQLYRGESK